MIFRFADFELDSQTRELRSGGHAVETEPRSFDLLLYLLENRARVVGKEELPETALTRCVMKARKAVGDHADAQRVIRTVHGHGYRFIAAVRDDQSAAPAAGSARSGSDTRYTRSGNTSIAYQVIGSGPIDIVLVNGWVSNVEMAWEHPRPRRFLERLASFSRLINFDKRGTGLSDRGGPLPTFEERMDDVRAVMDAAGSKCAVLMGYSEGGPMCALFAATWPERTLGLVLYGTYMKRVRSIDYPWAPTREERLRAIAEVDLGWDQATDVAYYAPSLAGEPEFANWLMSYWRRSASPRAAAEILRMNTDIDMCHVLPLIRVPTLVMHRTHDRDSRVDEGRYIAQHIPGAKFIELPGADHLVWAGDMDDILDPVEAFVASLGTAPAAESVLVSILAVHCDSKPDANLRRSLERNIETSNGHRIGSGNEQLLAGFDGTGRALRCALNLRQLSKQAGCGLRIGVHVGECLRRGDTVGGPPLETAVAIAAAAPAGEVAVSRIVRDLVSGYRFDEQRRLTVGDETLTIFGVCDSAAPH
jgi:pimeloyl-ACP methyl ester carboxylesterase